MTASRERAASLADQLHAELAKLGDEPEHIQRAGGVLTLARFMLEPLARNLRDGLYAGLEREGGGA